LPLGVELLSCGQSFGKLFGRFQRDAAERGRAEFVNHDFGGFLQIDAALGEHRAALASNGFKQLLVGNAGRQLYLVACLKQAG